MRGKWKFSTSFSYRFLIRIQEMDTWIQKLMMAAFVSEVAIFCDFWQVSFAISLQ